MDPISTYKINSYFITDRPDSINLIQAFMTKPREYKMRCSVDIEIPEVLFQFHKTYEKD